MSPPRIAFSLLALAAAAMVARIRQPGFSDAANHISSAREEIVYRLARGPLQFPLPAGSEALRVLINLDQPVTVPGAPAGAASAAGTAFAVRIRISPDGSDRVYPLWAERAIDGEGHRSVFYLDGAAWPSRTVVLGIARTRSEPAILEAALEMPEGRSTSTTASLRVLVREERPANRGRSLGRPADVLAPARAQRSSDAAPSSELNSEGHWAKVAATSDTATRRIYFYDQATRPPPPEKPPRPLPNGHVVALTLTGPGTVSLRAVHGAAEGPVNLLTNRGRESARTLQLAPGTETAWELEPGLTTLRLDAALAANLVFGGSPTVAGDLAGFAILPDGQSALKPRWMYQDHARAEPPPSAPVVFALTGRPAGRELLIRARGILQPDQRLASARLLWKVVDGAGRPLDAGILPLTFAPAHEDLLTHSELTIPSQPVSLFLWPPSGAATLELTADQPLEVAAASPAWDREEDAAPDVNSDGDADDTRELAPHLRLRYAPVAAHRAFFPVQPINRAELLAQGRIDRLQFAPRLERQPEPPARSSPSLAPVGVVPRFDLLVPLTHPVPAAASGPGLYWALPPGREVAIGARAGQATLLYLGDARTAAGAATIKVDGQRLGAARLFTARGKLRLPIPAGEHRLRVDVPSAVSLFVNRPVSSGSAVRFVSVYPLDGRRGLRLRVAKRGRARNTVGVVLYGRGPVPQGTNLHCTVDAGQRRAPPAFSADRTRLDRHIPIHATALLGTRVLNVAGEVTWTSDPIFIALSDDLPRGAHEVSVSGAGSGAQVVFARFFVFEGGGVSGGAGTGLGMGTDTGVPWAHGEIAR